MISDERLLNFCRALNDTVRSGLVLSEAFEILSKSRKYRKFLAGAAKMTADGSQLHEAFAAQKVFPPVFIALVRAGEDSGKTEEFLALYADCLEIRIEFRRRIWRAMLYPLFAVLLGAALLFFAMLKVIPMVLQPFLTSGTDAPAQLLWITDMAGYLAKNWPPVVLALCAAAVVIRFLMRSMPGRRFASLAGHVLPGFSFVTLEARLYHIYTITGLLLKAGLAPGAMMAVMLQFSEDDPVTRRRFSRAASMLSEGKSFAESLGRGLPEEDLHSLEVAERAGRLDETLLRLGKVHYDRHLHRLKLLVTGFKITAAVTIALVTFLITATLIGPVKKVLMSPAKSRTFQPSKMPSGQSQSQSLRSGGQPLPNTRVITDPTALFNQAYGRKVADLVGNSAAGEKQPPKLSTGKTRLGQGFKLKPWKFQKPAPTDSKTTTDTQ